MTDQKKKQKQEQEEVYRLYLQSLSPKKCMSQTAYEAQGLQRLLSEQNDKGKLCGF